MTEKEHIQFRRVYEWTMVYLNGELQRSGDSYLADEWLQEHFGVELVEDDAGHCMIDNRTAIRTLAEVEQREQAAAERKRRADALLEQAEALKAEAARIESGA